jgi:DNA topoisomerase-6 subunit B
MVVFVHMASVWVPFTSESKEAIADYDEIRKEIKLALQECGRRLGVFLRKRERAKSEFRRRNIFELYIEEVVEACARLKEGHLAKDKLRNQLHRLAMKRTGGLRTDEILGRNGGGPEGLPHSIIVTPDGPAGEAPEVPTGAPADLGPPEPPRPDKESPSLPRVLDAAKSTAHGRKVKPARLHGVARPAQRNGTTRAARPSGAAKAARRRKR